MPTIIPLSQNAQGAQLIITETVFLFIDFAIIGLRIWARIIKRKTFDETGKRTTTDQVLEVPIKPGLKKGSKIKFKGVGDQEEGGKQDLHFIVEEVSDYVTLHAKAWNECNGLANRQHRKRTRSSHAMATT